MLLPQIQAYVISMFTGEIIFDLVFKTTANL